MKSFAWYDLQVIICSGIMMMYYLLVLRNKRFHQYNRFYILASFFLSFIIPLIKIQLDKNEAQKSVVQFIYVLADYNAGMDEAIAAKGFQLNWDVIAIAVYALVSAFFLLSLLVALLRIRNLLKKHSCKSFGDVYLILTNVKGTPFSFFNYIFWNEEISLQSATGQQILQHELTHVKERHSIDNIITQVVMIFGWFNPFFWWARKELQMIHEFIADKKSVDDGDVSSLAAMLLAAAYPQQQYLLTNSFFFSPIKRRLLMITNNKNPRFSYLRRLVVLPLMAVVVMLFAFRTTPKQNETLNQNVAENNSADANMIKDKIEKVVSLNATSFRKDTTIVLVTNDTTGKQPIFFLDGKKITHDEMSKINPNNIESMNVLKDKAATDKYGNEGKNGVIEIVTKNAFRENLPSDYKDFLKRNKDVRSLNWSNDNNNVTVNLNDGTSETYLLWVSESKQRAIDKYGALPIAPPPPPSARPVVTLVGKKIDNVPKNDTANRDNSNDKIFVTGVKFDKVFTQTQVPSEFPGGKEAWQKYLERNLNRNLPVKNGAGPGKYTVELSFIVDDKGIVSDIKALNNPGYETAEEAMRMIKKGPMWVPAKQNGKNVTSWVKQSITFVVTKE